MKPDYSQVNSDGVTVSNFKEIKHEDLLYREASQPTRDLILANNAELRKNPGVIRDLSFARLSLRIPLLDMEILKRKYKILRDGSNQEQRDFWHKFMKSSESLPYRVY